jgi:membrane protease subunit (stomatin/prohibitin family)
MLRRRPIARLAVGTAVVAGTAGAVSNHMAQKQASQAPAQEPQQAAPAPAPTDSGVYEELEKLGKLHEEGILTDEEFAAQKAKILG